MQETNLRKSYYNSPGLQQTQVESINQSYSESVNEAYGNPPTLSPDYRSQSFYSHFGATMAIMPSYDGTYSPKPVR